MNTDKHILSKPDKHNGRRLRNMRWKPKCDGTCKVPKTVVSVYDFKCKGMSPFVFLKSLLLVPDCSTNM